MLLLLMMMIWHDKNGNLWQGSGNGGMVGPHPELGQQVDVVLRLRNLLPDCLAFNFDNDFNDGCSLYYDSKCQLLDNALSSASQRKIMLVKITLILSSLSSEPTLAGIPQTLRDITRTETTD